jgi:hypothetical protein
VALDLTSETGLVGGARYRGVSSAIEAALDKAYADGVKDGMRRVVEFCGRVQL